MKHLNYFPASMSSSKSLRPYQRTRFVNDRDMEVLKRVYRKMRRHMSAWDARCTINDLLRMELIFRDEEPSRPMPAGYETWF